MDPISISPTEVEALKGFYQAAQEAFAHGGWTALLPFVPMTLVNLYKLQVIQDALATRWPKLAWANLSSGAQMLVAFLVGAAPVFLYNAATGGIGAAAMLSVFSGIAAVIGFKPLAMATRSDTATAIAASVPAPVAHAASIVLPLDMDAVKKAWADKGGK